MLNLPQNKTNILDTIEIVSLITSVGGAIASLVYQQVILASLPLSLTVGINLLNRKKLLEKIENLTETNQEFITKTEVLKYHQELSQMLSNISNKEELLEEKIEEKTTSNKVAIKELKKITEELYLEQKQLEELITSLKEIVKLSPVIESNLKSDISYYQMGINHKHLGNIEAAIKNFTTAININHNHGQAYFNRGLIFVEMGEKKAALDDFRNAAKLFFENGDIENYQQAKDFIRELHNLNHNSREADILALESLLS